MAGCAGCAIAKLTLPQAHGRLFGRILPVLTLLFLPAPPAFALLSHLSAVCTYGAQSLNSLGHIITAEPSGSSPPTRLPRFMIKPDTTPSRSSPVWLHDQAQQVQRTVAIGPGVLWKWYVYLMNCRLPVSQKLNLDWRGAAAAAAPQEHRLCFTITRHRNRQLDMG